MPLKSVLTLQYKKTSKKQPAKYTKENSDTGCLTLRVEPFPFSYNFVSKHKILVHARIWERN
jgi:hypothetical protein